MCVCVCRRCAYKAVPYHSADLTNVPSVVHATAEAECVVDKSFEHVARLHSAGGECTVYNLCKYFNPHAPSSSQHHPSTQDLHPLLRKTNKMLKLGLLLASRFNQKQNKWLKWIIYSICMMEKISFLVRLQQDRFVKYGNVHTFFFSNMNPVSEKVLFFYYIHSTVRLYLLLQLKAPIVEVSTFTMSTLFVVQQLHKSCDTA